MRFDMYYNKVEICGVNTAKLKTLSDERKRELLLKTKEGDFSAREELIYGNLRLVLSVIQRFTNRNENIDDIFQVGCLGLIKAIDNFNINLDVKFSTYAVPMIIGEIRRYLRDNNSIRISRSVRDLAYQALNAREELARDNLNEPTVEQIALKLGQEKEVVVQALEAIVAPISIYEPVYNDNGDSLYVIDQLSDLTSRDEMWLESIALSDALKILNERERLIIDLRFFANKTQMEIAELIGISQAQVSRIEKGALERMRKQFC
jgi:RNA polymerase sporulation-specific sigma factor